MALAASTEKKIDLSKYERMKKLGMPMDSILNRMAMDGIDRDTIFTFSGATKNTKTTISEEPQLIATKPNAKMKPLHWGKITQHQADGTLWIEIVKDISNFKIDYKELEELFQQPPPKPDNTTNNSNSNNDNNSNDKDDDNDKDDKKKEVFIIDPKRAQNVMIGLKNVGLDEDQILESILKLDDSKMPPETVRKLINYVPTDSELQMIRGYIKDGGDISLLSKAEKFFAKLIDLVGIKQVLTLWLFKSEFPSIIKSIKDRIDLVYATIEMLKTNTRLKKVFGIILCVGNFLNSGSTRGNAFGFHLQPTLELLEGVKATDKKTSLIVYIVDTIGKVDSDALLWVNDLQIIEESVKIQSNALRDDVDAVKRDMEEIDKKVKAHRRTMTKTHSEWSREGAALSLNMIASHFRTVSRAPKAQQNQEWSHYDTLRAPMAIKPNFGNQPKPKEDEDAESNEENVFAKVMLRFYKQANSLVREIDTLFKKAEQDASSLAKQYGVDEDCKWEELFKLFARFRESFIKAQKGLEEIEVKKKEIKRKALAKSQLEDRLQNRKKPEEITRYQNHDSDDNNNNNNNNNTNTNTTTNNNNNNNNNNNDNNDPNGKETLVEHKAKLNNMYQKYKSQAKPQDENKEDNGTKIWL